MGPYLPQLELAQRTSPSQSENGRWDWRFHTVRGGIDPGDIRVRLRVVGVADVWMNSDPRIEPYRPRVALTLCTSHVQ